MQQSSHSRRTILAVATAWLMMLIPNVAYVVLTLSYFYVCLSVSCPTDHSFCHKNFKLSARYWGELRPDSPTYARFPNLLYTAELLSIKQNKNKVLPPYVHFPCHKVADAGNSTSSFSISAILHSCMFGCSCFLSANILIISWHPSIVFVGLCWLVSIGMHLGIF